jgi:hypothetical protein
MPIVQLKTVNFPAHAGVPNGTSNWDLPWPELVWAAVSVGKGSLAHITQFGRFSMFEIIYRAAIIYANLMEKPDGRFGRSDAYDGLDPSEKGAISYFLGLALTKAFVASKLDVPWLMHVDVYRNRFGVNLSPGERPDLFGEDRLRRWVVAESKGRTNGHDADALKKAKGQAEQVISISGAAPHLSVGLVASFANGRLSLVADDPPVDESRSRISLELTKEEFRDSYYRPIRELLEEFPKERVRVAGRSIDVVRSESSDLLIGLVEPDAIGALENVADVEPDRSGYLGPDGIYIELGASWADELMCEQPQERRVRRLA